MTIIDKRKFMNPGNWASIAAALGSLFFFMFVIYSILAMPAPYNPYIPYPTDGSEVSPNLTFSWIGGNPSNRIIYTVANLFGNDLNPNLIYRINIYNNTKKIYSGVEIGDSKSNRIRHKPAIELRQGSAYSWEIIAENNFGRITKGNKWNFTTKDTQLINFNDVNIYNDSGSRIWFNQLPGDSINLSFYLNKSGWVGIWAPVRNELHKTKGLMFNYEGGGSPSTFEVKLGLGDNTDDKTKETTYQLIDGGIKTNTNDWIDIPREIPFDEFEMGWNNSSNYSYLGPVDKHKIRSIHIAFSNKPEFGDINGTGWVRLYNLRGIAE